MVLTLSHLEVKEFGTESHDPKAQRTGEWKGLLVHLDPLEEGE